MEDKIELKPCPFCKGEAKLKHGLPRNQKQGVRQALVQCRKCGCRTPLISQLPYEAWKDVDDLAIALWNRRCP